MCILFVVYCRRRSRRGAVGEVDLVMASESSVSAFMEASPLVIYDNRQQESPQVVMHGVPLRRNSLRKGYDCRAHGARVRNRHPISPHTDPEPSCNGGSIPVSIVTQTQACMYPSSEPWSVNSGVEAELRREMASIREEMGRMQAGVEGERMGGEPPPAYD